MRANKIVRIKYTYSRNPKAIHSYNRLMTFSDWAVLSDYIAVHERKERNPYKWYEIYGPFQLASYLLWFHVASIKEPQIKSIRHKITSVTLLIASIYVMIVVITKLLSTFI